MIGDAPRVFLFSFLRDGGTTPAQTGLTVMLQRLGLDLIKTHKWTILPCSAMTGQNLNEGLEWVVQDAKDRLFLY